jgi:asparagine synthetase B (glutamine-hydrolysing)
VNVIDLIDYPQFRYGATSNSEIIDHALGGARLPPGQYAFAVARQDGVYLARDPIGCNKLFLGYDVAGQLVIASRAVQAWRRGVALSSLRSCPPGHVIAVSPEGIRDMAGTDIANTPAGTGLDVDAFREQVRDVLDQAFSRLARAFADYRFAVCLSGGIDSSVIASFAIAHLPGTIAASFTYLDTEDLRRHALGTPVDRLASASDDFRCAARVAEALGLPLLPVVRSREAVAGAVATSVRLCQDWRDFNVHCATVNLFLAQDIRAAYPGEKLIVLTGDLMNEYVCDYSDERIDDTIYYRVPRVPADRRRKHFVRGLDSSDRETGVFWAYGLAACQPFAVLAEPYMRIPAQMLDQPDLKWALNGPLLSPSVSPHVNRAKTRAQVGGKDLGTLGIYHRLGVGDAQLRRAWRDQFPGESPEHCDEFIQLGRYKVPQFIAAR